jgi:hypothetical protein
VGKKVAQKFGLLLWFSETLPEENNRPRGENTNLATLSVMVEGFSLHMYITYLPS